MLLFCFWRFLENFWFLLFALIYYKSHIILRDSERFLRFLRALRSSLSHDICWHTHTGWSTSYGKNGFGSHGLWINEIWNIFDDWWLSAAFCTWIDNWDTKMSRWLRKELCHCREIADIFLYNYTWPEKKICIFDLKGCALFPTRCSAVDEILPSTISYNMRALHVDHGH